MYNWFSKTTVALALLTAGLASCKKDEVRVSATPGAAPTLATSTTAPVVLLSGDATKTAAVYTWTPMTLTLSDGSKAVAPVNYSLEFAKTGTNFASVGTLDVPVDATRDSVKVADLNTALIKAGLTPTVATAIDVRLRTRYSGNQADMLSNVVKLTATPYSRDLFFYGTSIGVLGSSSPYIREQAGKPAQYEGYIYVPSATNTFRLSNTSTAAGTVFGAGATSTTITSGSGATDFSLTGPSMYRISINLATGTFKAEETRWGIIGAATTGDGTGWNQSIPMTYDVAKKVWKLVDQNMPGASGGNVEFKFRANDAWAINFGESKTQPGIAKLEQDGDNLKTAGAGKYDITLNLNDPEKYTYTLTKK
jgi:starch-binding outer membrane protein SusE/F